MNVYDSDPDVSSSQEREDPALENSRLRQRIAELEACEEKQRQTEERCRNLEEQLNYFIEAGELGAWQLDLITGTAWRSLRHDNIFGYESLLPEWTYDMFLEHVLPEDRGEVDRKHRHAVATSSIWEFECRIRRTDGSQRWIWAHGKPVCNERNEPVKMYGMVRDITKHKDAEERAREIYQLYRVIFENSEDGLMLTAPDGQILDSNPAASRILGYSREEITAIGRNGVLDTTDPRLGSYLEQRKRDGFATGELTLSSKDGRKIPIEVSSRIFLNEKGESRTSMIFRDISRRLETEMELKQHRDHLEELVAERTMQLEESHQTLKALMEYIPEGITIARAPDVNITMMSRFGQELTGRPIEPYKEAPFSEHPAIWDGLRGDGVTPASPEELPLARAVLKGEISIDEEWAMRKPDGKALIMLCNAGPICSEEGKILGGIIAWRDITERKRMETALREEIEERTLLSEILVKKNEELDRQTRDLQQSNKELELFAYTASHDLREPLRKFTVFADRLRIHSGPKLDDKGLDYLARMENAAHRMTQLLDGLLELSRVTTRAGAYGRVDLSKVIEEVQSDLEVRLQETGAVIEAGPLPVIEADPLNMQQLFQNLISNAVKFCTKPPRIVITSRPLDYLHEITIQDNGIGFEEKYLDVIFKPFQQLHERGTYEGIGMGLAICQRIVSRHHGTITAKSTPGEGSAFIFTLPGRQGGSGTSQR